MNVTKLSLDLCEKCRTFKGVKIVKMYFKYIVAGLWATVGCQAATLIPNQPTGLNLPGIYYDYYNIRFSSLTGETGADANVYGDSLKISFGNFGGATSGSGLKFDFSTAHVGFVVQSEYPSAVINDLRISATGTYSAAASMTSGSWAEVITQIPFNLQVVGVNGIPYTQADLVRGYSLNVLPSQVTVVQNGDRVESGSWNATWSIAGLGASLASIFNIPTMSITALDLAVTPDLSNMSMDGTSSLYLNYLDFSPIPEPSSLSLLAMGGAAWIASRRRQS